MKKFNFTAMKRNCFLFIALFLCANSTAFAQIQNLQSDTNIKFANEKAKKEFTNLIQNAPLIIRGDFVSGTNPSDVSKRLPDEKPYIENNWYMVPKKIKINAVLRGDTALIGKIITVPFNIGLAFEDELINSSHTLNNHPFNDQLDEYYFLSPKENNVFTMQRFGYYHEDYNDYNFHIFAATEKSFFQAIIDSKNYNPKFMLEAGMKIPEAQKKAVGFLVKETEEPNDKNK